MRTHRRLRWPSPIRCSPYFVSQGPRVRNAQTGRRTPAQASRLQDRVLDRHRSDPIDTSFGYAFDQVVDAVQRSVEKKDGYILDRCWLPWEFDRKAKPAAGTAPSNLRETTPGILLFRHGRDKSRNVLSPGLCVVFLVGETPMGGIHKQAFFRALDLMRQVGHPENAPVRVVGPYFSGSQTSLQFVIGDWWAQSRLDLDLRRRIVSRVSVPDHHRQRLRHPQERILLVRG